MKKLIYQIEGYTFVYNHETEKEEHVLSPATVTVECTTQTDFDVQYSVAKERAMGEIIVEGEFDDVTIEPSDRERIDALEAAILMLCMPDMEV